MDDDVRDILVVDDDPLVRESLVLRLEAWGFGPRSAGDVDAALHLLREHEPTVLIVDLVLPGRSGMDLLRELKNGRASIPVVLITAHGGLNEAREALLEGADDVLSKPLSSDRLRAVIDTVAAGGKRAVPFGSDGGPGSSPGRPDPRVTADLPIGGWARRAEKTLIAEALRHSGGDEEEAARELNLPLDVFRTKRTRYR